MHMGESKQQPWALLEEQWAAHSPTRAPDFITGLSIPPSLGTVGPRPGSSCWPLRTDPTLPVTEKLSHHCIPPLTALSTPNLSIHALSTGELNPFPVWLDTQSDLSKLSDAVWKSWHKALKFKSQLCQQQLFYTKKSFFFFFSENYDFDLTCQDFRQTLPSPRFCSVVAAATCKLFRSTRTFFVCVFPPCIEILVLLLASAKSRLPCRLATGLPGWVMMWCGHALKS